MLQELFKRPASQHGKAGTTNVNVHQGLPTHSEIFI